MSSPASASTTPASDAGVRTTVDVVVVAYNSRDTLRACVEPLAGLPWARVIVVDNQSPDDSAEVISDLAVDVIRAPRNGGFAYGCNIGIAAGTAELVLLLNPDTQLEAANLERLVESLRSDAELGGVGPRTVDEHGDLDWTQRRFPRLRSSYAQALLLHRAAPRATWTDELVRDRAAYERAHEADWLSGSCVLLRRAAVEAVDGLDEGFFLYSEETDLFRRMRTAGWRARFEPGATVLHVGGVSAPPDTTRRIWVESRVRYARKHHGPVVAWLEALAIALGAVIHVVGSFHRPARARGYVHALGASFRAARASRTAP
jgi:N-acetylglucosaminyl-diphospho-decaprenol L-rhamnosyltransferase